MNTSLHKSFTVVSLQGTPWHITGASEAARHTGFFIPELNMAFDAGVATSMPLHAIFITHCHYDHTRELPSYFLDASPITPYVFVPQASVRNITTYVVSAIEMTKNIPKQNIKWSLKPMDYETPYLMTLKNIRFKIEPFKCTHSVPCLGYGLIEIRTKLKQEYYSSSQQELEQLKRNNIAITDDKEYYHLCFIGDTDHKVLETECAKLEKYRTIIIECTYLLDDDMTNAKKNKHMHWTNLKPFILSHPNITFILYHFSIRYVASMITDFFLSENVSNVVPFVNVYDIIEYCDKDGYCDKQCGTDEQEQQN